MNSYLEKLYSSAENAGDLARSITESGLRSVTHVFRGTTIFGALSIVASCEAEYDETHYVLVPILSGGYSVYTKRVLPAGVGATNELQKKRVFHIPEKSGQELLERVLITQMIDESQDVGEFSSEFADKLELLADQIDRETRKVSGGLFLIGGAIAFVNPLLGVGIAAKSLLPSIGSKVSKTGASYVGGKLRSWGQSSEEAKIAKSAYKEVKSLKPEIYKNSLVQTLEALATNPDTDYDPFLDEKNWVGAFEHHHYFELTVEAINEVYEGRLSQLAEDGVKGGHVAWLKQIMSMCGS